MRASGFVLGLALGALLGAGGTYLVQSRAELQPPRNPASEPAVDAVGATEEPPLIGRAGDEPPRAGPGALPPARPSKPAPAEATPSSGGADDPKLTPEQAAREARREAWAPIRAALRSLRTQDAGSEAVLAKIAEWRAVAKGDGALAAELSARALVALARMGKLRPGDSALLRQDFDALPAGAPARPGLAGAVARMWAKDPRLSEWIAALPRTDEPQVRRGVIWALDETPSAPYREWVLRMSETEPDARVLDSVWNEDIVGVNLTRSSAPRFTSTIETRIGRGDLPPETRAYGYMALGLAAQHTPAEARRTLAALLTTEGDPGVAAFGRAVLLAIEREEANLQSLEGLWDEHEDRFGTK